MVKFSHVSSIFFANILHSISFFAAGPTGRKWKCWGRRNWNCKLSGLSNVVEFLRVLARSPAMKNHPVTMTVMRILQLIGEPNTCEHFFQIFWYLWQYDLKMLTRKCDVLSDPNWNPPYQSFIKILCEALKNGSLVMLNASRETFTYLTFLGSPKDK